MNPAKRLEFAKDKHICFSCLRPGKHTIRWCKYRSVCGINGCKYRHSKLLHQDESDSNEGATSGMIKVEAKSCACGPSSTGVIKIALPIVAVRVKGEGQDEYIETHAILDPGSNKTFCSQSLLRQLGIRGSKTNLSLSTLNEGKDTITEVVALEADRDYWEEEVPYYSASQGACCQRVPRFEVHMATPFDVEKWDHLQNIDVSLTDKSRVSILIGQDVPEALLPLEIRRGRDHEPYALRTHLGWVLNGPLNNSAQDQNQAMCNFIHAIVPQVSLEAQVEQFWKLDTAPELAGSAPQMSLMIRKC